MKLKALKPRLHNIMFHTHTVSGIVISFALFIIFYAGSIALFMDELHQWENPEARVVFVNPNKVDYDKVLSLVIDNVPDFDINKRFLIAPPTSKDPLISFYGDKKSTGKRKRFTSHINPKTYGISTAEKPKTHMARTIYQLHYFRQIPIIGLYLSGLVAVFLLFAVFTGVLTHWKNITNKFYAFTTKGKWKQIWANGHISLGFITLPFQVIFAVTGSLLGLSLLLLGPSAYLMFDGDRNEIVKIVRPGAIIEYDKDAKIIKGKGTLNSAYQYVVTNYSNNEVRLLSATNYGKEDGTISAITNDYKTITGSGNFTFSYKDGKLVSATKPEETSYTQSTYGALIKLHYATYGGLFLKVIYFILAMITCYVILSGVMIWRTARDNKKYTDKQRNFHHRVTKLYLAITLSMFPAVGLIFIANKLISLEIKDRTFYVNTTFFIGWLVLIIIGLFWNNYRKLNRNYLFIGSLLGLFIPISNGIATGDWIWKTFSNKQYYIFSVDFTWIFIGTSGLIICKFYTIDKPETAIF